MIDVFTQQKLMKTSQVKKVLEQARTMFSKLPNVVRIVIPKNGRLTVCV